MNEDYLTIKEVTKLLKVSRPTLDKWDAEDILMKRSIGGRVYYKRSEIDEMLK